MSPELLSFFEVLWSEAGERIKLRDILIGTETEVVERSASRALQRGDIAYGQIWTLQTLCILGCTAPISIPPSWKGEVIGLRKKLRKKIAKQNRDLTPDDLVRHADAIRLTYLTIRNRLYIPPQLVNTDGDPLVFHSLKFRIESPETAFDALAPLALGQSKEELLEGAKFGKDGKLQSVEFDWRKKGNAKIPSWDNTVVGNIKIAGRSLIAEVNSENRKTARCLGYAAKYKHANGGRDAGECPPDGIMPRRKRTTNSNKLFFVIQRRKADCSKSFRSKPRTGFT